MTEYSRTEYSPQGLLRRGWNESGALVHEMDDTTRTVTNHITGESRPYTPEENQAADALEAYAQSQAEREAFELNQKAMVEATIELSKSAHADGEPWVQPTGAHDAYALEAEVTHNNKTWTSLVPFNVWEPPTSWREIVASGYPAWVQPTGGHDAYKIGDRVSFNGKNYESLINGNTWSPTDYPAGWKAL